MTRGLLNVSALAADLGSDGLNITCGFRTIVLQNIINVLSFGISMKYLLERVQIH